MAGNKGRNRKRHEQVIVRQVHSAMTTVMDPATPTIDLFNMGMIYDVRVDEDNCVTVDLAYSSPGLPANEGLPERVRATVCEIQAVSDCQVRVVDDPPWSLDRVSDYARIHLSVVGGSE